MSLLIDTGVFVAVQNERDERHDAANRAMTAALAGEYSTSYTNGYVYDEAVTLTRMRTGSHREACVIGNRTAGRGSVSERIELLFVTGDQFERTVRAVERDDDHELSLTDTSLIALVDGQGIDAVLSFDDDFDGLVDRIDPTTVRTS